MVVIRKFIRKNLKKFPKKLKATRKPNRFKGSRVSKRYVTTRTVSNMLSNYGENKFNGSLLHCLPSIAKPAGNQPLRYHLINLGGSLSSFLGTSWVSPMNLYRFPQGDGFNERTGKYMYLKNTRVKMEIQMNPIEDRDGELENLNNAYEFRVMVIKANRKYQPYGDSSNTAKPNDALFLDNSNQSFGLSDVGATTYEYQNNLINKRQFNVMYDRKFTLAPPSVAWTANQPQGQSSLNAGALRYPVKKQISINVPFYRKSFFQNTTNNETPTNIDTQTMIIVQCCRAGYCNVPTTSPGVRTYSLTVQGTTVARDS
ncbi:MAG: putative capsid protein [Cressdnaviricota sp.]|nr:MAG: putative capsid protein [Cressdnaviricota sp.]